MYVFYFNSKDGTRRLYMAKVVRKFETKYFRLDNFPGLYQAHIDPDSELYEKKEWVKVPIKEGKIYHRAFWLSEPDIDKAEEIVNSYLKEQWLKAKRKLDQLEKDLI